MNTFFMFGSYTQDAIEGIDADRTKRAEAIVKGYGGNLRMVYALLGEYDIVMIVELPGIPEATQVSLSLTKETGIAFITMPALPVADFDRLAADVLR
jgi:uncharacterized protein with GYD domain